MILKRLQIYGLLCGLLLLAWFLPSGEAKLAGRIQYDAAVFFQQETVRETDEPAQLAERLKTLAALPNLPYIIESGNAHSIPFSFPGCHTYLAEQYSTNRFLLSVPAFFLHLQGRSTDFYIYALRKIRI